MPNVAAVNLPPPRWRQKAALTLTLAALARAALLPSTARAHDPQDRVFDQVAVKERLGELIPTELPFYDQTGSAVQLSRYFTGGPVILTLNYYACPTLCPLVFRNLAGNIGKLGNLRVGRDFRVVTVSIDPEETRARAADKSAKTYAMLSTTPNPGEAWPFLLGSRAAIDRLTESVGVSYRRIGDNDFAHPNVVIIVTPAGRISRYLYGVELAPQDLKLALIEASEGRIGAATILNRAILYCFHYDPVGRRYVLFASRIMTGSMLGVLILTAGLLSVLWKKEKGKRRNLS